MTDEAQGIARREALDDYDVIGRPPEQDLQSLVELAAQLCGAPTAVVNLIDHRQQHQVAAFGLEPGVCSVEDSMCARILDEPEPVRVPDARLDTRFAQNPFVTGVIADVRFYASTQLRTPSGVVIGTLCVFDEQPRELSDRAFRGLSLLGRQVVDVLELLRATRELQRSNDQLARFAGQVSHDLLNPLTALKGFLEIVSDSPPGDELARHYLARAAGSADRMAALVDELLDYARLGGRLRPERVDLGALCAAALDDLGPAVEGAGAVVSLPDALPEVVGDPVQLRAVVQNLLANALKFTRDGEVPRIRVAATGVAGGWRVAVHDAGPGVPEHLREKVFELLERGGRSAAPGVGIGLSTCRRVVEAHGGRIGIDESPDGGACVWFVLPDAARPEPDPGPPLPTPSGSEAHSPG